MKHLLHTMCVLLMLATYFWGGCVSCSQFFMFSAKADNCCKHGKCKQSKESSQTSQNADRECSTLPFAGQQHQSDIAITAAIAFAPVETLTPSNLFAYATRLRPHESVDPLRVSPPDLVILTGSFLI